MSKAINLGRKPNDNLKVEKLEDFADKTYYPTLYLGDVDPDLLDLPDEGSCTIKYKIRRREHTETKHEGEKPRRRCSIDMDVISIEPPEKKKYGNGAKSSDGGARKAFNDYFGKE